MNKKISLNSVLIFVGILMAVTGALLIKQTPEPQGIMVFLPYVCLSIGCGVFGHGVGKVINTKTLEHDPELQKQIRINETDERNLAISNRAKAKAYDIMISVYGILMVALAMMDVDVIVVLLLVFTYLFVIGCHIYYRHKYDKEM